MCAYTSWWSRCACMCVYGRRLVVVPAPLPPPPLHRHHHTSYRIVEIPERARPNSSKVDTRPRIASYSSPIRPTVPACARPTSSRSRRLRRMGNRKTNPLGQIPVPRFWARIWPQSLPAARESRVVSRALLCACVRCVCLLFRAYARSLPPPRAYSVRLHHLRFANNYRVSTSLDLFALPSCQTLSSPFSCPCGQADCVVSLLRCFTGVRWPREINRNNHRVVRASSCVGCCSAPPTFPFRVLPPRLLARQRTVWCAHSQCFRITVVTLGLLIAITHRTTINLTSSTTGTPMDAFTTFT